MKDGWLFRLGLKGVAQAEKKIVNGPMYKRVVKLRSTSEVITRRAVNYHPHARRSVENIQMHGEKDWKISFKILKDQIFSN